MGPQGDRDLRTRNAGPDGRAAGIRAAQAAQGRARDGIAAHDHPDGRADRDARGAGRRRALVLVQHLLDAGPRRGRHRRRGRSGLRLEGRDAARVLVVYGHGPLVSGRQGTAARRGRRRRRHPADPQGIQGRERRLDARLHPFVLRGGGDSLDASDDSRGGRTEVAPHRGRVAGRERGDHHGRTPALPDAGGRRAARAGHQCQ